MKNFKLPLLVGLPIVVLVGLFVVFNPFRSDCSVAQGLDKQIAKDLKIYQQSLDDMRSSYVSLGFGQEFNVSVMGALIDKKVAKVASQLSDLEQEIAAIEGEEGSCGKLLELKKKQVDTHKEKLDIALERLDVSVTEQIKSRGR